MGKAEQHFEDRTEAGLGSPHSEASKMLEAALQQMDGIISGKREILHLRLCNWNVHGERSSLIVALKVILPSLNGFLEVESSVFSSE
jgi:hypothetical protein